MVTQAVTVELPEHLYRELQSRAAQAQRTVEDELLMVVAQSLPETAVLSGDLAMAVDSLVFLDDDALWRAARSHLAAEAATELAELHLKRQREGLTAQEEVTEQALARQYERMMLIRARAAALLHERGHDVANLSRRA
jgi:plasmid stability protein